MSAVVAIENLKDHADETVTVQGWLYHKTGKGKLQFLQVRDGSGHLPGRRVSPQRGRRAV